jgi:multiple sugar transport system substrate-binding protein
MNWGAVEGTPLQTAIDRYIEEKGTAINVWPVPTRYEDKMRTLLAAGTTPDIMRVNDDYVRGYAAKDQLVDLTPYLEEYGYNPDDFYPFIYQFPQFDGGYWAWALGNQPRLIFYNIDMFEEAGVDLPPSEWNPDEGWTWDDFLETAKALTQGEEQFGALVFHDTGYEQTWAMNNGSPGIYSEDGLKFTLADPEGIEAIQWVADLTCVHGVQPEPGLLNQLEGPQLFISGRVGMIFTGTTTATAFRQEITDFNWDVAPPPMRVNRYTEGSLIVFCLPTSAASPDAGWDLLDYMTNQEMGELFVETRYFMPIRRSASETIQADDQPPQNVNLFVAGNEYHRSVNFAENTERARFIYRPQLDLVYSCTDSAESVLTTLRPEVQAALEGTF